MKRWIVIANCQTFGLANSILSLAPDVACHGCDVREFQTRMREQPDYYLENYDFAIIAEEARLWFQYTPEMLPPHIDIPNITFSAFHPDCCYVTAGAAVVDGVVGPYQSMIALAAYKEHIPPVRAATFFNEAVYQYAGYLDLWQEQRDRLVTQFAAAGVAIGPGLRRMSHGRSFMFTVNHPKIEMLFEVARAILVSRNERIHEGSWPPPETLAAAQWPIYPEVGRRLGLTGGYVFKPAHDPRPISLEEFLIRSHDVFSAWDKSQLSVDPGIRPRLWRIRELMREAA
ncbi:MAG: WcbI family polysaccharide biosynthesis putative acetyltransferase [Pseudomonadota bacterium]